MRPVQVVNKNMGARAVAAATVNIVSDERLADVIKNRGEGNIASACPTEASCWLLLILVSSFVTLSLLFLAFGLGWARGGWLEETGFRDVVGGAVSDAIFNALDSFVEAHLRVPELGDEIYEVPVFYGLGDAGVDG